MYIKKDIRNIGIFAHVDAGKTTLTENILYKAGCIKKLGRVDEGTAHTDSMEIERERGISVQAAAVSVEWDSISINIIDTPGHVDFSAEVERALLALDGAILVVSAMEGVQAQTEIIWKALESMKIPTMIFVNKIDRAGADADRVMKQLKQMTLGKAFAVQKVEGLEKDSRITELGHMSKVCRNELCEGLAEYSESILNALINDVVITDNEIEECLTSQTRSFNLCPVFFGAAIKSIGIEAVLNGIVKYLPAPSMEGGKEPSGIVYKIHHGRVGGKASFVRLYEGYIEVRKNVYNNTRGLEEKIYSIFKVIGSEYKPVSYLEAGEIGIVYGLHNARIGDVLGYQENVKTLHHFASPALSVKVYPSRGDKMDELVLALRILEEEDPLLNVQWHDNERELQVQLMGMIQMEILTRIIKSRFHLDAVFEKPSIVYKETPAGTGIGYIEMYTPYYATLRLMVEPLPRGSGVIYESAFTTDFIFPKFQKEVEQAVPLALKEGILGWEVTDVKVTLIGGRSTQLATKPSDFRAVTPIAVMEALKEAGTILLEPILEYELNISRDEAGLVMKDLIAMRASMDDQSVLEDRFVITGLIPMATSIEYPVKIASLSQGRSTFKTSFVGYRECSLELGKVRARKTVSPLDRENYILSISDKSKKDLAANAKR